MSFRKNKLPVPNRSNGFSLMELLVVIGVIAILAGLTGGVYKNALNSAAMAQDLAAGKTLGAAYQAYAAENNGSLMVGYLKGAPAVALPNGSQIAGEAVNRYVWRLAPYFDFRTDGVIYGKARQTAAQESSQAGEQGYGQSLSTSFGMNAFYVGGYYEEASKPSIPAGDIATRVAQVKKPSSLLVFATAKSETSSGYFLVKAPRFVPRAPGSSDLSQADWPKNGTAASTGFVDARYSKKALCVFLDGSIRSYTTAELEDMRLWSINAAENDNAGYAPTLEGGSGGRGNR